MRINKYVALATGMSRRAVDVAIAEGRVEVNGGLAEVGQEVSDSDQIILDNKEVPKSNTYKPVTLILNKPTGYVCSRDGQGSKTVYDLLPTEFHHLKPVGRLDKDSSGLLLMTNDGKLAHQLTHPSFQKEKIYEVVIDHPLSEKDFEKITKIGVDIGDGISSLRLTVNTKQLDKTVDRRLSTVNYLVHMHEGRNRQIRLTFAALGYEVTKLNRIQFGIYKTELKLGDWRKII